MTAKAERSMAGIVPEAGWCGGNSVFPGTYGTPRASRPGTAVGLVSPAGPFWPGRIARTGIQPPEE